VKQHILKSLRLSVWLGILCLCISASQASTYDQDPRTEVIISFLNSEKTMTRLSKIAHKHKFSGTLEYQMAWKKGAKVLHCRMLQSSEEHHPFVTVLHKELMKLKCKVKIKPGEQVKLNHKFHFQ
jgi:hypothetical protein